MPKPKSLTDEIEMLDNISNTTDSVAVKVSADMKSILKKAKKETLDKTLAS